MRPRFAEGWWQDVPVHQLRQEIQNIYHELDQAGKSTVIPEDGDLRVLAAEDVGGTIVIDSSSATKVSIPSGLMSEGEQLDLLGVGSGTVTVAGGTGVTLNGSEEGTETLDGQWARATLLCLADDKYALTGNVT